MEHFYDKIQKRTFFNFQNVYEKIIKELPDNSKFVEIGVWRGQSVCFAAVEIINLKKNITIYAVDTWEGSKEENLWEIDNETNIETIYENFLNNIEPVKDIIVPIKKTSVEASKLFEDKSLDFVFIDASHLYEEVKKDINHWFPKVKIGGYIGGHDYTNNEPFEKNGVKVAVDEIFGKNIEVFNIGWGSWLHKVS
jgi:hypothetical protein